MVADANVRARPHRAGLIGLAAIIAALAAGGAPAQQLVYTPINPAFGGNPFNSSQLLAIANAQNQFLPKASSTTPPTQAQQFAAQLQSTILAGVAQQVSNAIFGNNPQQSGTISFGGTTVNFTRGLTDITIVIIDPNGVSTQIVVPTFVATPVGK
ncbi:curli assembly protein CsgF [Sphingomonas sp. GB1N7]|uniref:curli assembly protein CsgF n=1 Tax=Parasphingomonas caseinilytica TaxID=3096158 RepID=UPI002FC8A920